MSQIKKRDASASYNPIYDPAVRSIAFQVIVAVLILGGLGYIISNASANLEKAHINSGFGFFKSRAGFDVLFHLIDFNSDSTYGTAFIVGLMNTLLMAACAIVVCTIIGFIVGIARLSKNWLLSTIATSYIEVFRNIPLVIQLYFWYKAVLSFLPGPRQGIVLPLASNLSNRGLIIPRPIYGESITWTELAVLAAVILGVFVARWAKARQMSTGRQFPTLWVNLGILVALPGLVFVLSGSPLTFEVPELHGFNFVGGLTLPPEFVALLLGLSVYTSTYVAETVRAGVMAVSHGQVEAASALGLSTGSTMKLIVVPQAMRTIIPPLTNTYVNLIKDSSLAVTVGYPDLVSIFTGTVLNQTGQAVEVIFITMLVFLFINLVAAIFMNYLNARWALRER